jgi:16S rRNA (adenine1518-N6/adenine1519-N6)-dimethyltransferase
MKMRGVCFPSTSNMPRKRRALGQHFLNSVKIAERIVELSGANGKTVVEIGSGRGILTGQLVKTAKRVIAVEIDSRLANFLIDIRLPHVFVLNCDFLSVSLSELGKPVVIGNIPYSLTSAILHKLAGSKSDITRAVLTIQKEYGRKMTAEKGNSEYGYISVFANYHFTVCREFIIPARYFSPKPQVSSVVVSLEPKASSHDANYETGFFEFVAGVFRYRRKVLRNAILSHLRYVPLNIASDILAERPQNLSIGDFLNIYEKVRDRDETA